MTVNMREMSTYTAWRQRELMDQCLRELERQQPGYDWRTPMWVRNHLREKVAVAAQLEYLSDHMHLTEPQAEAKREHFRARVPPTEAEMAEMVEIMQRRREAQASGEADTRAAS